MEQTYRILNKKLYADGSRKKHDKMIQKYSDKKFLTDFLSINGIFQVFVETTIYNVFGLERNKDTDSTPDIIVISNDTVYIGEFKSKKETPKNTKVFRKKIGQAIAEVQKYRHILKKYNIKSKGFIIVGNFKKRLYKQ